MFIDNIVLLHVWISFNSIVSADTMEAPPTQLEAPAEGTVSNDTPRPRRAPLGVVPRGRGRGRGRYNFFMRRRELAYLSNFRLMCRMIENGYGRPFGNRRGQVVLNMLIRNQAHYKDDEYSLDV